MITYPSTHGVYEHDIREITDAVHAAGGQVYVDGANLNALLGFARFGDFGGDVSHLNLHKTFCIPHGGGGPGVGPGGGQGPPRPVPARPPAGAAGRPSHGRRPAAAGDRLAHAGVPVSSAPYGSPSILPISWAYVRMMGTEGLAAATGAAVLSANYVAARLRDHFPVLYAGENGLVAHECILDLRPLRDATGVTVDDVAKRLIDYGFHSPTMSFPVAGTLMVEPTESEDLAEIDRFVDAMIAIAGEAADVASGRFAGRVEHPCGARPHTAESVISGEWTARVHAATRPSTRCAPWFAASTGRRCAASTRPTATATCSAPARRSRPSPEHALTQPVVPSTRRAARSLIPSATRAAPSWSPRVPAPRAARTAPAWRGPSRMTPGGTDRGGACGV